MRLHLCLISHLMLQVAVSGVGWGGSQGPECLQACRVSHVAQSSRDTGLCVGRAGCWWLAAGYVSYGIESKVGPDKTLADQERKLFGPFSIVFYSLGSIFGPLLSFSTPVELFDPSPLLNAPKNRQP